MLTGRRSAAVAGAASRYRAYGGAEAALVGRLVGSRGESLRCGGARGSSVEAPRASKTSPRWDRAGDSRERGPCTATGTAVATAGLTAVGTAVPTVPTAVAVAVATAVATAVGATGRAGVPTSHLFPPPPDGHALAARAPPPPPTPPRCRRAAAGGPRQAPLRYTTRTRWSGLTSPRKRPMPRGRRRLVWGALLARRGRVACAGIRRLGAATDAPPRG